MSAAVQATSTLDTARAVAAEIARRAAGAAVAGREGDPRRSRRPGTTSGCARRRATTWVFEDTPIPRDHAAGLLPVGAGDPGLLPGRRRRDRRDYVDIGVTTLLIRGFDPLDDAVDYGRRLIPPVRQEVARRDALAVA